MGETGEKQQQKVGSTKREYTAVGIAGRRLNLLLETNTFNIYYITK